MTDSFSLCIVDGAWGIEISLMEILIHCTLMGQGDVIVESDTDVSLHFIATQFEM